MGSLHGYAMTTGYQTPTGSESFFLFSLFVSVLSDLFHSALASLSLNIQLAFLSGKVLQKSNFADKQPIIKKCLQSGVSYERRKTVFFSLVMMVYWEIDAHGI